MKLICRCLAVFLMVFSVTTVRAQWESQPVVVENYFRVKWGHDEEFLELYKRNHYPLIQALIESGSVLSLRIDTPMLHMPEESRWDYRITITFKDEIAALNKPDPEVWNSARKRLLPDEERWIREENLRFEILDAHWDVFIRNVPLGENTSD